MVVTAFSSTPNKEEFCKKLGANDVKSSLDDSVLKAEAGKYDIVVTTFCGVFFIFIIYYLLHLISSL